MTIFFIPFSDEGLVWDGIFSSLFVAVDKKGLAHLLAINNKVGNAIMCEILFGYKFYFKIEVVYKEMQEPIAANPQ